MELAKLPFKESAPVHHANSNKWEYALHPTFSSLFSDFSVCQFEVEIDLVLM